MADRVGERFAIDPAALESVRIAFNRMAEAARAIEQTMVSFRIDKDERLARKAFIADGGDVLEIYEIEEMFLVGS